MPQASSSIVILFLLQIKLLKFPQIHLLLNLLDQEEKDVMNRYAQEKGFQVQSTVIGNFGL